MKSFAFFIFFSFISFLSQGKISLKQNSKLLWPFYDSESSGFNTERLIFGGNLGMDFIKRSDTVLQSNEKGFSLFVSPTIGYRFGNRFVLGLSAGYNYFNLHIDYKNFLNPYVNEKDKIKSSSYSISMFARYFLMRNIFLHLEPEWNQTQQWYYSNNLNTGKRVYTSEAIGVPSLLAGVGFVIPMGNSSALVIQGLYDVLQKPNSPYNNLPVIRGGFNFGFY